MQTNRFENLPSAGAAFLLAVWLLLAADGICASIIAAPYCPQFCECGLDEKGISWANCSRVLPERVRHPEVRRLTVVPDDGVALDENSVLHYIPSVFPKLQDLHVARCGLTHLSRTPFKQLGSLREADLSGNRLTEISPHLFLFNQKLVYVNFENNPLKINSERPFLVSNSIVELDLSGCNLTDIAPDAFSALPALKYLRLGRNRLTSVHGPLLPMSLSALDLSHNLIRNVPIAELMKLKELREIDLSENPINCTCELVGFQNWISGQGVIFLNNIICSTPFKYRRWRLLDVPQYELCEATLLENSEAASQQSDGSDKSSYDEDYVSDNVIVPNARDLLLSFGRNGRIRSSALDEGPDAIYENDEMLPVQKRASKRDSQNKPPPGDDSMEGSGDNYDQNTESSELNADIGDKGEWELLVSSSSTVSTLAEASVRNEENNTVTTIPTAAQPEQEKSSPPLSDQSLLSDITVTTTDISSSSSTALPTSEKPTTTNITTSSSNSSSSSSSSSSDSPALPSSEKIDEGSQLIVSETKTETTPLPQTENENYTLVLSSTENSSKSELVPLKPSLITGNLSEKPPSSEISSEQQAPSTENSFVETSSTGNPLVEPSASNATKDTESGITKELITGLDATPETAGAETDTKKPATETIFTSEATVSEQFNKSASATEDLAITTEAANKTEGGDPFGQPHTGEQEQINLFGFGLTYIIPCVVVIAFMLVCVAVYASQRRKSFRKNWSLEDSNRQNEGGTELQDISLLSDTAKGNIVKRVNKYPDEAESEQTVRLMTPPSPNAADEQPNAAADEQPNAAAPPPWQSDSAAPSNGQIPPSSAGSEQPDSAAGPLPNGETLPKTAPIAEPEDVNENELQLTKAKVTVLPDSIPKTAVIVKRNSAIDDAN